MSISHMTASNSTYGMLALPPHSYRDDPSMKGLFIATANRQRTTLENLHEYRTQDFGAVLANMPVNAGMTTGPVHDGLLVSQIPPPSLTLVEACFGIRRNYTEPKCFDMVQWRTYDLEVVKMLAGEVRRRAQEKWVEENREVFLKADKVHNELVAASQARINTIRQEHEQRVAAVPRRLAAVRGIIDRAEDIGPVDFVQGGGFRLGEPVEVVPANQPLFVFGGDVPALEAERRNLEARRRIETRIFVDQMAVEQEVLVGLLHKGPDYPEFKWDTFEMERPEHFVAHLGLKCLTPPGAVLEAIMSPFKLDLVQQELRDSFSSIYGKLSSTDPVLKISAIVCVQMYLASLGYEHLARALVEEKMRLSQEGFFRRVGHSLFPKVVGSNATEEVLLMRRVAAHPVASSMLTTAIRWLTAAGTKHKDKREALVLELASVYSPYCTPESEVIYLARLVADLAISRSASKGHF